MFEFIKRKYFEYRFNKGHKFLKSLRGTTWIAILVFNKQYFISINQTFEDFYNQFKDCV